MSMAMDTSNLREMDALVAMTVMGWTDRVIKTETCYPMFDVTATPPNWGELGARYHRVPDYSTDIQDAWLVVEKIAVGYRDFRIDSAYVLLGKREYFACVTDQSDMDFRASAIAETAPLAICLTALKAVGVQVNAEAVK